jgi:hypothetical protein
LFHAALAAIAHLVHDVCRWVGRRGARREAVGERSSATEPDRREAKPTARDVRAQGDDPLGEASGGPRTKDLAIGQVRRGRRT